MVTNYWVSLANKDANSYLKGQLRAAAESHKVKGEFTSAEAQKELARTMCTMVLRCFHNRGVIMHVAAGSNEPLPALRDGAVREAVERATAILSMGYDAGKAGGEEQEEIMAGVAKKIVRVVLECLHSNNVVLGG